MTEAFNPFPPAPEPVTELGRYKVLSSTAGVRVSPLQLGGMSIGDAWSSFMGSLNKADAFRLLDAYHDLGGNFIDTANNYQNEQSEQWIGEWMHERGNRDLIVVTTKYSFAAKGYKLGTGKTVTMTGNHKKSMRISLEQSLKNLQTDYVDLFYVHWWDHVTSIPEVMDSLDSLVQSGKVLYLGISDTPAWIVSAANEYATAHGKTPFSVYQGRWNVMARDFERDIIPMARHYGMALAPWDVLGGGKFQSKKQIAARQGEPLRSVGMAGQTAQEEKISAALEKVAGEQGVESLTAIALAYVLHKTPNVFPIVGGRKVEHLKANIQALEIRLTEKQIEYLESVQDFDIGFPLSFIGQHPRFTGKAGMMVLANAQIKFPPPERGW